MALNIKIKLKPIDVLAPKMPEDVWGSLKDLPPMTIILDDNKLPFIIRVLEFIKKRDKNL